MTDHANTEKLLKGYSGRMFLSITLGAVIIRIGRAVIPPLLPEIVADLSINSFKAGIALSVLTLCFAFVQYPSGEFSDRTSRTSVLLISLLMILVGFTLMLLTQTYLMFVSAVAIIGISNGMYPTTARAFLSDIFIQRRGEALAFHIASIDVGGILGVGLATVILATVTWQLAFLLIGIILTIPILLIQKYKKEDTELTWVRIPIKETCSRLLRNQMMRRLLVAYSLFLFTIHGIFGFLPTLLQADYAFSPFLANSAFALLFVIGLIFKPLSGLLSDRLPRILVIVSGFILTTLGLIILVIFGSVIASFTGILLFGVGQKGAGSIIDTYLLDISTESTKGSNLGAVRMIYMLIGSAGPMYTGYVSNVSNFKTALGGLVLCMVLSTGVLLIVIIQAQR